MAVSSIVGNSESVGMIEYAKIINEIARDKDEQSVNITISSEGQEKYRESMAQNKVQINYADAFEQKENLKENKGVFDLDYGYKIQEEMVKLSENHSKKGTFLSVEDRADNYLKVYAKLYDDIVQGYEKGTREIYVPDGTENVNYKLTKEDELSALDAAYKKSLEQFDMQQEINQHAHEIFKDHAEQISKIRGGERASRAIAYVEEGSKRKEENVPENIGEKVLKAVDLFKQRYQVTVSGKKTLMEMLSDIKVFDN